MRSKKLKGLHHAAEVTRPIVNNPDFAGGIHLG